MNILGIIPARFGSKGVPRKNVRDCAGRPLFKWTEEAAMASKLDRVVISTNDPQIAAMADIEVRWRPEKLCGDDVPMPPVVVDVLDWLAMDFDAVMVLQPTCPLRTSEQINEAINELASDVFSPQSVISVTPCGDDHPYRTGVMSGGAIVFPYADPWGQRQELPMSWRRSGDIYLSVESVWRNGAVCSTNNRALIIKKGHTVNIDTETDFALAEILLNARLRNERDNQPGESIPPETRRYVCAAD